MTATAWSLFEHVTTNEEIGKRVATHAREGENDGTNVLDATA